MGLKLLIGQSGSGKSTKLYTEIIKRSIEEPKRNFLILVPDQFTMQTQMDLVKMHDRGGILNIDVLSFSRLAHRIFEEVGRPEESILDDTGKSLVLRLIANDYKEELTYIGGNLHKNGYINEVKSAISEFMQYDVTENKMEDLLTFAKARGGLYYKLKDLNFLYEKFKEYMNEKYITTEEIYHILARKLKKSNIIKDSVVILDGFTGFTPVQNNVIREMLLYASEVVVTILMDGEQDPFKKCGEQELFSFSRKTIQSLISLSKECGCEEYEIEYLKGKCAKRFEHNEELSHLERNIFRYPLKTYQKKVCNIHIHETKTMEDEVKVACQNIQEIIKKHKISYREIAVITGDLSAYETTIKEQFHNYGIPLFLDKTNAITLNPLTELITSSLSVVSNDYTFESVFRFLKSGMIFGDIGKIDELENYVYATGIKGKKVWSKEWEDTSLEEIRKIIVGYIDIIWKKSGKTKDFVKALYTLLETLEVQSKLKELEYYFENRGEFIQAKEYAQIYPYVIDLLDQIISLIGEEKITIKEFIEILEAGFLEIQIGSIPQTVDQVLVGDIERTRLKPIKALFFLGVNDGNIPKSGGNGGILSDIDREFLSETKIELSPTPRQKMFIQRFYLYMNMTKPSDFLYLSYLQMGEDGKSKRPSYLIETVLALFPTIEVKNQDPALANFEEGKEQLSMLLQKYVLNILKEEEREELFQLANIIKDKQGEFWFDKLMQQAFVQYEPQKLSKDVAKMLYGVVLQSSISRLEKHASCAYSHFLQFGLKLEERKVYKLEARDMGNVFHGILEEFARNLSKYNYTLMDFPKEIGDRILDDLLKQYETQYGGAILQSTNRNQYVLMRAKRILTRTIQTLQYQLQKGKFIPEKYELSYEEDRNVLNEDYETNRMKIRGRIDRLDTYEKDNSLYVKVVDYKSGNQKFSLASVYVGLQLQLVVYLDAAMNVMRKKHNTKQVKPAAMFYYHIDDPFVEVEKEEPKEVIDALIYKELNNSGLLSKNLEVLEGLDKTHPIKSDVAPLEFKKDGSLSSRTKGYEEETFQVITEFVNKKVESLGGEIISGNISINPYEQNDRSACTFCNFKEVCGFDRKIKGYEKRNFETLKEEEIIEIMREEVKNNGDSFYGGTT